MTPQHKRAPLAVMTLWQRLVHMLGGHTAAVMIDARDVCAGVLDVTYGCACGKSWMRTFRTTDVQTAMWFADIARCRGERRK